MRQRGLEKTSEGHGKENAEYVREEGNKSTNEQNLPGKPEVEGKGEPKGEAEDARALGDGIPGNVSAGRRVSHDVHSKKR